MPQAHNYRCTHRHCRRRWRLPKALEAYATRRTGDYRRDHPCLTPGGRCKSCRRGFLAPTNAQLRRQYAAQERCNCGVPHHPHRAGSTEYCLG